MASVWVPFTSESKEAIADYDEIRREIKLALQECGRRLGVFLRRRERAQSEFRRRNIFELYIEEVVEACARLKGGKLPKDKLRTQLQRIASRRTGGVRTDEILGQDDGPHGLPHSIIVSADGAGGEAAELPDAEPRAATPTEEVSVPKRRAQRRRSQAEAGRPTRTAPPKAARAARRAAPRTTRRRKR